jgi:hypothetical protein
MDADDDASADEENAIYGYAFAVGEDPYCCWEWDLEKRNLEFLAGLDDSYYINVAQVCGERLETDSRMSASIALRGAYHQGLETLFSLVGAYVQAPGAVPAWLAHCRTKPRSTDRLRG